MPEQRGSLRVFSCGDTTFPLSRVFRGEGLPRRTFPSAAFLYTHPDGRRVLFDTGYPPTLEGTGPVGALYRRILPARIAPGETVDAQLRREGIEPGAIDFVVLSHLHPDHVGGLAAFPDTTLVLSAGQLEKVRRSRITDGVFAALIPPWFADATRIVVDEQPRTETGGVSGFDLFGDGRFVVTPLPGHALGHLGALVEGRVLLAGDAAWGREFLEWSDRLRPLPRLISDDSAAHHRTSAELLRLEASGVTLCFSHDAYPSPILLP
ncbi:MBL fold metallo-hydrolase [Rathayibacter sp. VKM Ac-2927]|uniref:MBL fold metallo-hydrolase n=1 Tax=Rathayibacter sp. VKM Ac-2927 TaxID=2929478 RepID=UPI001FB2FB3E|nr:MBL fold metallo-hydrolase [Rathayibacter sp. VKM Ac-2927]MCJ1687984.1 MBL fold metallo-hydrolase [Rathayibacter sp. VKM Ac-2927]